MTSLERVGVGHNQLLELPDLSKLQSLTDFDCENNLLMDFPWELLELPKLEVLVLFDNPFALTREEKHELDMMEINY